MFIYSETYAAVCFIPFVNDVESYDRCAIWFVPGVERDGDGPFGIDTEYND
jgi:hypothetical protein